MSETQSPDKVLRQDFKGFLDEGVKLGKIMSQLHTQFLRFWIPYKEYNTGSNQTGDHNPELDKFLAEGAVRIAGSLTSIPIHQIEYLKIHPAFFEDGFDYWMKLIDKVGELSQKIIEWADTHKFSTIATGKVTLLYNDKGLANRFLDIMKDQEFIEATEVARQGYYQEDEKKKGFFSRNKSPKSLNEARYIQK